MASADRRIRIHRAQLRLGIEVDCSGNVPVRVGRTWPDIHQADVHSAPLGATASAITS